MSKVDWENAPSDAEAYIDGVFVKWSSTSEFEFIEGGWVEANKDWTLDSYGDAFRRSRIEMRPDEWKKGAERMEQIAQNGNGGEVYDELDNFDKQPRYKGDNGLDWIDEFARDNSIEDFRAAMRFTIGKYEKRLGKKDAISKELYKMSDYYKRWSEVEKKLEKEQCG
mgnify:CR=1 FL=1